MILLGDGADLREPSVGRGADLFVGSMAGPY